MHLMILSQVKTKKNQEKTVSSFLGGFWFGMQKWYWQMVKNVSCWLFCSFYNLFLLMITDHLEDTYFTSLSLFYTEKEIKMHCNVNENAENAFYLKREDKG